MTPQQTQQNETKPAASKRMNLAALVKGKQVRPMRITLFGVEGVGKSTFAAAAPAPVFLGAEDGTAHLDVTRFPMPGSWSEVLDAIRVLETDPHEFKTFVLDTLDWAEPMIWDHICKRDSMASVEAYGYGKGYTAALDEWRRFLAAVERLRERRGMHVIFLAHSWIKPFKNPEGDDFDRYEMKLNAKASGLIKEWCDVVLFANHETFAHKDAAKRVRGVSTGARLIYTDRTAAYDAKNRYDLPGSMPLSWPDFEEAVKAHKPADPTALRGEIERKAKLLGDLEEKLLAALAKAGTDAAKLAKLNDWANGKLAERAV